METVVQRWDRGVELGVGVHYCAAVLTRRRVEDVGGLA